MFWGFSYYIQDLFYSILLGFSVNVWAFWSYFGTFCIRNLWAKFGFVYVKLSVILGLFLVLAIRVSVIMGFLVYVGSLNKLGILVYWALYALGFQPYVQGIFCHHFHVFPIHGGSISKFNHTHFVKAFGSLLISLYEIQLLGGHSNLSVLDFSYFKRGFCRRPS